MNVYLNIEKHLTAVELISLKALILRKKKQHKFNIYFINKFIFI